MIGFGLGLGLKRGGGGAKRGASILLSGVTVSEDATVGTLVGTFSVINATGTPTFTLEDDAGGLFVLDGNDLEVAAALDYETATSHQIEVSVAGTTPAIANRMFTINVTNIAEGGEGAPMMNFSIETNNQLLAVLDDF